jgi:hypothetical protein
LEGSGLAIKVFIDWPSVHCVLFDCHEEVLRIVHLIFKAFSEITWQKLKPIMVLNLKVFFGFSALVSDVDMKY